MDSAGGNLPLLWSRPQYWVQYTKQISNLACLSYHQFEVHSSKFLTTDEPTHHVIPNNWKVSAVAVVYVADIPPYRCAEDLQGMVGGGGDSLKDERLNWIL